MKKVLLFAIISLSLTCVGCAEAFAAPTLKYVSGIVRNQQGSPIAGAHVLFRFFNENYELVEYDAITNSEGRYEAQVLGTGEYFHAKVTAQGYAGNKLSRPYQESSGDKCKQDFVLYDGVQYHPGQRATIILPEAPDPALGRYYRLDRIDNNKVVFEREYLPKADTPYVIYPSQAFTVRFSDYDFMVEFPNGSYTPYMVETTGTAPEAKVSFVGTYNGFDFGLKEPETVVFFDTTADCEETGAPFYITHIGGFHAFLLLSYLWPHAYVFEGEAPEEVSGISESQSFSDNGNTCFDLQGRRLTQKPTKGVYIQDGKKVVVR